MDKRLAALYTRERELKEDELHILELLKMVREEMHKMQVEQMQWENMVMPITQSESMESAASTPQAQPLNESEVNAQVMNLEVPQLNELFMQRNKKLHLDEEEEEESEDPDEPDAENENSDEELFF